MPMPRAVAKMNRRVTNRILRPVVAHLPGFAIIEHVGRRSGRTYRTPVNIFRHDDRYVVALTYGRESEWARNVLERGSCVAHVRGRPIALADAELVHDPSRALAPRLVRPVFRAGKIADFLVLSPAGHHRPLGADDGDT